MFPILQLQSICSCEKLPIPGSRSGARFRYKVKNFISSLKFGNSWKWKSEFWLRKRNSILRIRSFVWASKHTQKNQYSFHSNARQCYKIIIDLWYFKMLFVSSRGQHERAAHTHTHSRTEQCRAEAKHRMWKHLLPSSMDTLRNGNHSIFHASHILFFFLFFSALFYYVSTHIRCRPLCHTSHRYFVVCRKCVSIIVSMRFRFYYLFLACNQI